MSSSPDHLYLDLSIINNDNTGSSPKTNLNFNETRTNPILDNPSNYFLTIARFEVDTPAVTLPIFIPLLEVDGYNSALTNGYNSTAYTITIAEVDAGGLTMSNVKTRNILWNNQDYTATIPNNPTNANGTYSAQDITTGYYNCYTVEWWLNCINYTLLNVWNDITGGGSSGSAPFMTTQANTNLISLYTPPGFAVQDTFASGLQNTTPIWGGNGSTPTIQYAMFFNEPLFNLFSSFNSVYYGNKYGVPANAAYYFSDAPSQNLAIARPYLFNYYIQPVVYPNSPIYITDTLPPITFNIQITDYSPVPMWNPVQSIAFTTSLLPVVLSYATQAVPYNNPSTDNSVSAGNNSVITNMMSDIQVGLTSGTEYKPTVLYVPENEYRFIDLNGVCPINQASFSVSYKTKYNQQIAFRLGSQCGANLKVLFRRKRFNLANLPPYDTN